MQLLMDEELPQLAELRWTHPLDEVIAGLRFPGKMHLTC